MRRSGVTLLNNAVSLAYPFRESIRSLLPLVDELIVNVGQGDDGTWEAVSALDDSKIKAFRSEWNLDPRCGQALSEQTNLALARCQGDWTLYLQADEVLHEDDLAGIATAIDRHANTAIEGLVFDFMHFYGSPHIVTHDWFAFYPRAVRAIKNRCGVISSGDAAGFVRQVGSRSRGLLKARCDARVFHYGWADEGKVARARALSSLYHDRNAFRREDLFPDDLSSNRELSLFSGTHPQTMSDVVGRAAPARLENPHVSPPWLRAWLRFLSAPRARLAGARPFLPLWITNLHWRLEDWKHRTAR